MCSWTKREKKPALLKSQLTIKFILVHQEHYYFIKWEHEKHDDCNTCNMKKIPSLSTFDFLQLKRARSIAAAQIQTKKKKGKEKTIVNEMASNISTVQ